MSLVKLYTTNIQQFQYYSTVHCRLQIFPTVPSMFNAELDLQTIDVTSRWREDWQSATVVNSTLVVDPTIRLPGFEMGLHQQRTM